MVNALRGWLCGLLAGSLLATSLPVAASDTTRIDRIVAVVNDEPITALELDERLAQVRRQNTEGLPPEDVLVRQVLDRLVMERVQLQFARERGIRIDEETLGRAIERVAANNRMDEAALRAALAEDGISWEQFRDQIRNEMLLTRVREREVQRRVTVTEAEIDNFLANNPDAFGNVEYRLAHIFLSLEKLGGDQEALSARVQNVVNQLGRGVPFPEIARAESDAPDAASNGDFGWRKAGAMPELFARVAPRLAVGQVSPPLRSSAGAHFVLLVDKRGGIDDAEAVRQTHASHILVTPTEMLPATEVRSRLIGLRERIVRGDASFADMARAHSEDLTGAKGGDLGWVYPGDMVPSFERAMDALADGEVSMPVESPFGWHLIKVHERRIQTVSDERMRALARSALREKKGDDLFEDWVRQLRDEAYVDYRLERY